MRRSLMRWVLVLVLATITTIWLVLAGFRVAPGATGTQVYLGHSGILTSWEDQLQDWLYMLRGERQPPLQVVYVDVDSQSIADLGNFPWDRGWFAEVSEALVESGGVPAVGLDFVFSSKGQPELLRDRLLDGNKRFAEVLIDHSEIVLAASYTSAVFRDAAGEIRMHSAPLLIFGDEDPTTIDPPEVPELELDSDRPSRVHFPQNIGLIDTLDGGVRWVPAFAPTPDGGRPIFHLSIELAARMLGAPREGIKVEGSTIRIEDASGKVLREIPLARRQLLEVHWFSSWDAEQNLRASFSDVLAYARLRKSEVAEERAAAAEFFDQFRGSLVLIGPVDPFLQDISPTPLDSRPVPRVGVHGNLVKTIVEGAFLKRVDYWGVVAITLALTGLITWLSMADGRWSRALKLCAFLVITAYVSFAYFAFSQLGFQVPLVAPLGAAFTTSFIGVLIQLVSEQQQKGRIRSMFSTYAPEQIVNRLVESGETPRLGGVQAEITAYFSDIQGFSTMAEQLEPERLVELMNEYLSEHTDLLYSQYGLLDKYVGDAVVAMFGGLVSLPDHARRGCLAALAVQRKQRELCEKWAADGRTWPKLVLGMRTRIGLHAGPAIVGNIGSRQRFNYTMMGDTVNLAARLESGSKYLGVYTLASDSVRQQVEKTGGGILFRALDCVEVVGRSEPLWIHEVVCETSEATPELMRCMARFASARLLYSERKWEEAGELFEETALLERNQPGRDLGVNSNPSLVFAKRCKILKANPPPAQWDGVFRFTEK